MAFFRKIFGFGWGALPPRPPAPSAKWGRLEEMIFFSAPLTTRAPPTTVRPDVRPNARPNARRNVRPNFGFSGFRDCNWPAKAPCSGHQFQGTGSHLGHDCEEMCTLPPMNSLFSRPANSFFVYLCSPPLPPLPLFLLSPSPLSSPPPLSPNLCGQSPPFIFTR